MKGNKNALDVLISQRNEIEYELVKNKMMKSIELDELREYMRTGKIKFSYKKKNGEIRNAIGTLDMSYIDEKGMKPTNHIDRSGIFTYFDIEKDEWRSCLEDNIIEFEKPDAIQMSFI